jgi:hypothetical protein
MEMINSVTFYDIGKEIISREVNSIFPEIFNKTTNEIRALASITSAKLRDAIASRVVEKLLPANTEEYTGTLPLGTRFHRRIRDTTVLVVEQQPTKRTILITPDVGVPYRIWQKRGMKPLCCYSVPFPYVIFLFHFQWFRGGDDRYFDEPRVYAFYRKAPLESEDDVLYHTNLPNIESTNCCICMGQTLDQFKHSDFMDINQYVHKYLARFWSRGFTCDYQDNYHQLAEKYPEYFSTIRKWQVAGKKNSNFVMDIDYRKYDFLKNVYHREFGIGQKFLHQNCVKEIYDTMDQGWREFEPEIARLLEKKMLSRDFINSILLKVWKEAAFEIEMRMKKLPA